LRILK